MPIIRQLLLGASLACCATAASAAMQCGEPCHSLVRAAHALEKQGKYEQALARYGAAQEADPAASLPLSLQAGLLMKLASAASAEKVEGLRVRAWTLAERALTVADDDPVAHEVLRLLDNGGVAPPQAPNDAQAWRSRSDALLAQDRRAQAEAALYAAIAADPSQRPTWSRLSRLRAAAGLPLKSLAFRRGVRVMQGVDGTYTIHIDGATAGVEDTPNHGMRLMLGMSESNQRQSESALGKSAYEIELGAWRTALMVMDKTNAFKGEQVSDPALLQMQALARDGQLEPAILLLMFRPSYRPALEAWLAANPGGVKLFIDRYGLRP